MAGYDHCQIDKKWQSFWKQNNCFLTAEDRTRPKYYVLDMFPYPSGSGLHVGHPKGYVATDVVARAKRMMGFNVLRVMGWDSFGLPAERQAVREDKHPKEITERNVQTFKNQLDGLGLSYDWEREIATSDASYYKWTQWIFLQLYNKGLAYQAEVGVNWCPALGTVLANEEVSDGKYVETGDLVERRLMKQWMLKITAYADRLLEGLDDLDWPEGIKEQQRNWIGKSTGAEILFPIAADNSGSRQTADGDAEHSIRVFTTRPDTLFGCSYLVLAPEHPLVPVITTQDNKEKVEAYVTVARNRSERDRLSEAKQETKTGVPTGAFAINPITKEKVPIWVADYVIASYGSGAVFACPAHDERDYAFAKQFGLPIREVVEGGDIKTAAYTQDGSHVHSDFLNGLDIEQAKLRMVTELEKRKYGQGTTNYRLRDWLFSRQRYWGEPFPIYTKQDGEIGTVPESDLPVLLPDLNEYKPTEDGRPPLARASDWVAMTDPATGLPAQRETNTMPQWAGSCWYYLRFISPKLQTAAWDTQEEKYWMPVDLYVGGAEHATLHLLYARFWHHVLYDAGLVSTPEPFQRLFNQGMIHATGYRDAGGKYYYPKDVEKVEAGWQAKQTKQPVTAKLMKMSKSRYNVVNPDDMCTEYGADALRLYELFMGPLDDSCEWETAGVSGTRRFLDRAWRLVVKVDEVGGDSLSDKIVDGGLDSPDDSQEDKEVRFALHSAIKKVSESIKDLKFNTAISSMMTFVNVATKAKAVNKQSLEQFVCILSPFAPHVAEEMWQRLGNTSSLAQNFSDWPQWDEQALQVSKVTIAIQVLGKMRGTIDMNKTATKEEVLAAAKAHPKVAKFLEGKQLRREIYVPGKLVNFVVSK